MELIQVIEKAKFNILDEFYLCFPSNFFSYTSPYPGPHGKSLCTKFLKLEDLISSVNQQWWNGFFLEQYLLHKITPRGLRVLKQCSFLDPDLIKEWVYVSKFCTEKWIKIIITQRKKKFETLTVRIRELLPHTWLRTLKRNTIRQENYLIANKLGKFRRDMGDCTNNKVFC